MQKYVKLYFKKLLIMLFYVGVCFVISLLGSAILLTVANFFQNVLVRSLILIGIPAVIILGIVYHYRRENNDLRRAYQEYCNHEKMTFKKELLYMIKFPDFLAEILAFTTIIIPMTLILCIATNAPWFAEVLAGMIVLCIMEVIFIAIDFALWMIVHHWWK